MWGCENENCGVKLVKISKFILFAHACSCLLMLAHVCSPTIFDTIQGIIMLDKLMEDQTENFGVRPVEISGFSVLMLAHVCLLTLFAAI